ncbi:hypothetical protein KKB44_01665 [Candidatus Micrarchaeota archaeon]|nr:hypothetical protein [Candidatus Micrarchaeota archaeon]
MLETLKTPRILGDQIEISRNRRRIQLDVGFKGNLDAFITGREVTARGFASAMAEIGEKCSLIAGIGAGNIQSTDVWLDMTALAERTVVKLAFQGFIEGEEGPIAITHAEFHTSRLTNYWPGIPTHFDDVQLYPIAQLMLAGEITDHETTGFYYASRTTQKASFREIITEAIKRMEPGKLFALIAGNLEGVEFRPLKPEGPQPGRPFKANQDQDADVIWIKENDIFKGVIVASLDSSSYTAVHAHVMTGDVLRYGGHIERANVASGAEVLLLKAHTIIQADNH